MGVREAAGLCGEAPIVSIRVWPRGVQLSELSVGVVGLPNLALLDKPVVLVGDPVGVVWRSGEGDTGDSGLRNGELRTGDEPYPKGEGL